jgi:hypothetical protein
MSTAALELRAAAKVERDDWGESTRSYPKASAVHLALADLLDAHADDWDDGPDDCCGLDDACFECHRNKAVLRVARAINGGAS